MGDDIHYERSMWIRLPEKTRARMSPRDYPSRRHPKMEAADYSGHVLVGERK